MIVLTLLSIGAFLATYIGVERFRRWSLQRNVIDIPNERSSHSQPVPRGGGAVIVVVVLLGLLIGMTAGGFSVPISYFAAAILIAGISWLDDLYDVSSIWRLLVHALAAGSVVYEAGYWRHISVSGSEFELGYLGLAITMIWIIGITNAFNFMDGIDGIAGGLAVVAGIGWLGLGIVLGMPSATLLGALLASSSLAFLIHNWQPAKIFMGDVGSAFLGFSFGVIPLLHSSDSDLMRGELPFITVLMLWPFVFDSIVTLVRRALKRQPVWKPHREHIYQRLVISGYEHKLVSKIYIAFASVIVVFVYLNVRGGGILTPLVVLSAVILSAALFAFGQRRKVNSGV